MAVLALPRSQARQDRPQILHLPVGRKNHRCAEIKRQDHKQAFRSDGHGSPIRTDAPKSLAVRQDVKMAHEKPEGRDDQEQGEGHPHACPA